MKSKMAKATAIVLAMTMCAPVSAFAADAPKTITGTATGDITTSFDVYSPKLTVNVPVNANIQINPLAKDSPTKLAEFAVASNSLDIINASVDASESGKEVGIPVNATITASIKSKKAGVVTAYNNFTADNASTLKKIKLNLEEGTGTAATAEGGKYEADGSFSATSYTIGTEATYAGTKIVPITQYGSLVSLDIAAPEGDKTNGLGDAGDVIPSVASVAVTGTANLGATWEKDDITVEMKYSIQASNGRNLVAPTITAAPTWKKGGNDVTITVANVGSAEVAGMALHNDEVGYGEFGTDVQFADGDYTASVATNGTATITIPKDSVFLEALAAEDFIDKAQDLVIALSDGRVVVTTLTVSSK